MTLQITAVHVLRQIHGIPQYILSLRCVSQTYPFKMTYFFGCIVLFTCYCWDTSFLTNVHSFQQQQHLHHHKNLPFIGRSSRTKSLSNDRSATYNMFMLIDPNIASQLPADVMTTTASSFFSAVTSSSLTTFIPTITVGGAMDIVSPEPIHTAFTIATFLPQPFWVLMVLFPNSEVTKRCMTGYQLPLLCSAIHLLIVVASILSNGSETTAPLAEFNDVFDITGDPQRAFFHMTSTYPDFVAEEWSHVLTWDFFVGRYIWYDGLKKNINTSIPVLFVNLLGPVGLIMYWIMCQVNGKPFLSDEISSE